jgi:ElaB/YqjD/DUF883 family membrane-anchored ribosome-binding protein
MGFVNTLRTWLRGERDEAADALRQAQRRAEDALDRRERQLQETPEEAMARIQDEIQANDEQLDELRRRVAGQDATAEPPDREPRRDGGGPGA